MSIQGAFNTIVGNTERAIGIYKYFQNMEFDAAGSSIQNTAKSINTTAGDFRDIANYNAREADEVEKEKVVRDSKTGRFMKGSDAAQAMREKRVAPYIASAQKAEDAARVLGDTMAGLEAARGGSLFARNKALKKVDKLTTSVEDYARDVRDKARETAHKYELEDAIKGGKR